MEEEIRRLRMDNEIEKARLTSMNLGVLWLRTENREQLNVDLLPLRGLLVDPLVVGRRADFDAVLGQYRAHGLDTPGEPSPAVGAGFLIVLVIGDEPDHRLGPVELGREEGLDM